MEVTDERVADALTTLRSPVQGILQDGDDPAEVLALGMLVRRYAPENTDLTRLRESLEHSSLSEVVGDTAFAIGAGDGEDPDEADVDDFDELGEEEADLLGED